MPFLPPNQQRQSTEGRFRKSKSRAALKITQTEKDCEHSTLHLIPASLPAEIRSRDEVFVAAVQAVDAAATVTDLPTTAG